MKNDFREFYDENYIMHTAMSNATEEDLMHGEWTSNLRKYVDKVRTRTGKWKYIYPEDLKKKAENVKRDVSYAARNLKSKVTGKNKTFENKVRIPQRGDYHYETIAPGSLKASGKKINVSKGVPSGGVAYVHDKRNIANNYVREQKKGGIGMSKYAERHKKEIEQKRKSTPARSAADRHDVYGHFYDDKKNFHGGFNLKQSDYSKVMNNKEKLKKKKRISSALSAKNQHNEQKRKRSKQGEQYEE